MLNSDLFMMITESTNEEAELIRNLRLVSGVARNHVRFPPFLAVIGLANQGIMLIANYSSPVLQSWYWVALFHG